LRNAKDIATLKAISQNLMHANLEKIPTTTNEDELYDVLEMLLARQKRIFLSRI